MSSSDIEDILVNGSSSVMPNKGSNPPLSFITQRIDWRRVSLFLVALIVLCTGLLAEFLQLLETQTTSTTSEGEPLAVANDGSFTAKPMQLSFWIHCDGLLFLIPLLLSPHPRHQFLKLIRTKSFLITSLCLNSFVFVAEYLWYVSLQKVSASGSVGLANSSPAWVMVLTIFLLQEQFTPAKVCCVAGALSGVFCFLAGSVSVVEIQGYLIASVSALAFSLFQVYYRKHFDSQLLTEQLSTADPDAPGKLHVGWAMSLLASMSLWNLVLFWAPAGLFCLVKIETLQLSPSIAATAGLFGVMGVDCTVNFLMLLAIQIASPLSVSAGMLCTIPFVVLLDLVFHATLLPAWGLMGLMLVMVCIVTLLYLEHYATSQLNSKLGWFGRQFKFTGHSFRPADDPVIILHP